MKVFVDLDGTILSVEERCGRLFCSIVGLDYDEFAPEYLSMRREGRTNLEIFLKFRGGQITSPQAFRSRWMQQIESASFLQFDGVVRGADAWLRSHSQSCELFLCTDRQSREAARAQLAGFGLDDYFREILVTEQKLTKAELIISRGIQTSPGDWIVGDSPADSRAGKFLGLKTCGVLSGLSGRARLEGLGLDLLVESIADFLPQSVESWPE